MSEGKVQVYTGNGKGKTTAAWGQAMRAVGQGFRVAVVRFLKPNSSGEVIAAKRLEPDIQVYGVCSPYDPTRDQRDNPILRAESRRTFLDSVNLVRSGKYDLIVLDEICVVLHYGFVSSQELLEALRGRPPHVEIILTGRYAPQEILDAADLVTEMVEVKHPGGARKGIEF